MYAYLIRRLILLPITLFFIVLVNFVIVNMAPGEPTTLTEISAQGEAVRRDDRSFAFGSDERYLQFREFYGLTLPILFNTRLWLSHEQVKKMLWQLEYHKKSAESSEEMSFKEHDALRIYLGDTARFIMPVLLDIIEDPKEEMAIRKLAVRFFVRGGTRQAILGSDLTAEEKAYNRKISVENSFLNKQFLLSGEGADKFEAVASSLRTWCEQNKETYCFQPTGWQKVKMFFLETRFYRYMSRVLTLDFGTMRNDQNKSVIAEVTKRFKYSLTLALIPMFVTFVLCQTFGCLMAYTQNRWPDYTLNVLFLVLYAIPVFVVAPFLIEKIALHQYFPFSNIPIPLSGFTSPDSVYDKETSLQKLYDIMRHIALPLVAIIYGTLAAQSRISRTAFLEVLRQDYVRTAWAKGVPFLTILYKHVGRNAAITIVTSLAGSLGVVLGGSLIVETLFEINGFGKFFYDAIINRDYNVIMFSALAGSLLTLVGYLVADIAYTTLDPRVTLD